MTVDKSKYVPLVLRGLKEQTVAETLEEVEKIWAEHGKEPMTDGQRLNLRSYFQRSNHKPLMLLPK